LGRSHLAVPSDCQNLAGKPLRSLLVLFFAEMRTALALALTAFAIACGPGRGELSRPSSERAINCRPAAGSPYQYTARFIPGAAKNPNDNLYVTFTQRRPSGDEAAEILQTCIETTAKTVRIDYELLATAWFNKEGPLPLPGGAATLNYDPKTRTTKKPISRPPAPPPAEKLPTHIVEVRTSTIPAPDGTLVTLDVIFPREPAEPDVMKVLVRAIQNNVGTQKTKMNTSAYPKVGPVSPGATRQPFRGANGALLSAHFDAKTSEIRDQNRQLVGSIK
jgi:hypothetical protein